MCFFVHTLNVRGSVFGHFGPKKDSRETVIFPTVLFALSEKRMLVFNEDSREMASKAIPGWQLK